MIWERNKGYATEMLAQICKKAKTFGLSQLQLSVEKDNLPSVKTILKNGGKYICSFLFGNETFLRLCFLVQKLVFFRYLCNTYKNRRDVS